MEVDLNKIKKLFEEKSIAYRDEIINDYHYYIKKISGRGATASLECCVFLMILSDYLKPRSIMDLGSGFTSYVFRYFGLNYLDNVKILSVDTNFRWLAKTEAFCNKKEMSAYEFKMWEDVNNDGIKYDLIFFDLDKTKKRKDHIERVLENFISERTVIIFDDMHKRRLVKMIEDSLKRYEFNELNIKDHTLDSEGGKLRYCAGYYKIKKRTK